MHEVPLFLLIKYLSYVGVFVVWFKLLRVEIQNTVNFSIKWAGYKMLLGLVFGVCIAAAYAFAQAKGLGDWWSYVIAFGIGRVLEWLVVFKLVSQNSVVKNYRSLMVCVAIGVMASLLTDLLWNVWGFEVPKFVC
ncbi:hypothetical protein HPT27_05055 [Permianibacter sp. IMCC34836]|uniref:hypothetical protein n=1 Tax=Permianibacter fluminis TaxID=2738515 RepID=UPI0015552E1C|nr:hypothetical protein [Permianibacter fluminis]NQD36386.1 hypothetical protein [Permianibacter fluminis]